MAAVPYVPTPGRDDFWLVTAAGELDIATLPRLESDLARALSSSRAQPLVAVDLRAVTFADCSSIRALLRAGATASKRQGWLGLVCRPAPVGRLLRRLDLDQILPTYGSVDEAVDAYLRSGGRRALHPRMMYERYARIPP